MHTRPKATVLMNAIQITNCTFTEIGTRKPAITIGRYHERPGTIRRPAHKSLGARQQTDKANIPYRNQSTILSTHIPRPHCLENTLKPTRNLRRHMTLTEADKWLKGFAGWFKWNPSILDSKCPLTKRVLLENFLDDRLLLKQ